MTINEYIRIREKFQSVDMETIVLAYSLLYTDSNFRYIREHFGQCKYNNTKCSMLGDTIEDICALIEKIANGNSDLLKNWNATKDTLYIPAGLAFLDTMKDELVDNIKENN